MGSSKELACTRGKRGTKGGGREKKNHDLEGGFDGLRGC